MIIFKRNLFFQGSIFRFHVKFQECPHIPSHGTPYPYYSHTTPIRIPKGMGIVWEAFHKLVPLLGVSGSHHPWSHPLPTSLLHTFLFQGEERLPAFASVGSKSDVCCGRCWRQGGGRFPVEKNIAVENHHFARLIASKGWIFRGYVSFTGG